MKPKSIVVAGGTGFVGKNLVLRLLAEGHFVTVIDNFSTSTFDDFISYVKPKPSDGLVIAEYDITRGLPKAAVGLYPDFVINLACPASPTYYEDHQLETYNACVEGTRTLLEYAKEKKSRFIQASTSEIYGIAACLTQVESYRGNVSTVGPRACYSEGKRAAETLCDIYSKDIDVTIVRIFNTYGPGMLENDGRLIPELITKYLNHEVPVIYGNSSRCYMYISDLISGLMSIINSDKSFGIVNLGNPSEEYSSKEVAKLVYSLMHPGGYSILEKEPRPEDPPFRVPNIGKAKEELGFLPTIPLGRGLKKTIEYFKKKFEGNLGEFKVED